MSDLIDRLAGVLTEEEWVRLTAARPVKPNPIPPIPIPTPLPQPLTRLTSPDSNYIAHAYSTIDPWNINHTGLLLFHSGGRVALHYQDGRFYGFLPNVREDSRPVWMRTDPNSFLMVRGNELCKYDTWANHANWLTQPTLVHKFTEYITVDIGGGEGDISEDGNHLPLIGDKTEAFIYQISSGHVLTRKSTAALNAAYVTPSNNLITTGADGVLLWLNGSMIQLAYKQEHMDIGRDIDNSEILVWLDDRDNTIYKIRLSDQKSTPILGLGWSPLGGPLSMTPHICLPQGKPYAVVSTYGADLTMQYSNQILQVPLDGGTPRVLAHHKSDTQSGTKDEKYSGEPRAVSSNGQYLFDSREDGVNVVYISSI